jgi:hypothetical protein
MEFSGTWPLLLAMLAATVGALWWRRRWAGPSSETTRSTKVFHYAAVTEQDQRPRRAGRVGSR